MPRLLRPFRTKDKDYGEKSSNTHSKSRNRNELDSFRTNVWIPPGHHPLVGRLDLKILGLIFYHVCPHCSDDKYKSFEESLGATGDGCVLCETRDLAACMAVNRVWRRVAERMLYKSIRFECIHYCEREDWLREHRKKRNRPELTDVFRLQLLVRTIREYRDASQCVEYLKLPYQIREGHQAELARLVSRTTNLKYIDLPNGLYSDHPSCTILKQELIAGCPDLRFMKYVAGGEALFAHHSYEDLWYNLEVVSLESMDLEPDVLTYSLARMINLSKLNLSNMAVLRDSIFHVNPALPALPAVRTLKIADAPCITASGMLEYLRRPEIAASITTLQLENTGVQLTEIHMLLGAATKLRNFAIHTKVAYAMTAGSAPLLASKTIRQIYFEISNDSSNQSASSMPCNSYYEHLASSITSGSFPSLRSVRTYCPQFPDLLVSLAPRPLTTSSNRNNGAINTSSPAGSRLPNLVPAARSMPPRLSAQPGTLAPPVLPSPGMPPSLANRMSALSVGPGLTTHGRSQSSVSSSSYYAPPMPSSMGQRPSSSYGMGYSDSPFSPSETVLAQALQNDPSVPSDIVSRLGLASNAKLTVYTKPPNAEEMEWLVTEFIPPTPSTDGRPSTSGGIRGARPISLMHMRSPANVGTGGTGSDTGWLRDGSTLSSTKPGEHELTGSRGSRIVGNGFGGYIEVRDEGKKGRRKGADWMG